MGRGQECGHEAVVLRSVDDGLSKKKIRIYCAWCGPECVTRTSATCALRQSRQGEGGQSAASRTGRGTATGQGVLGQNSKPAPRQESKKVRQRQDQAVTLHRGPGKPRASRCTSSGERGRQVRPLRPNAQRPSPWHLALCSSALSSAQAPYSTDRYLVQA